MATPTPGKYPGIAATPPVSTPFSTSHLAFSPHGPRSVVPSPSQIKKSSPAGTSVSNQGFNMGIVGFDSPSAALALGMGADGVGDLGIDLHGMGVLGGGPGKDEEEKRRRLMNCVDSLKPNKGRLSEAGLERLARRVGLECLWEDTMGSANNGRTLIIAGIALALDIDFTSNIVQKVSLSFPDAPESVTKHEKMASDILWRDLQIEAGESPFTKKLDRFAANLEKLTMLDKLSVMPGLNCHEAVAGIFCSLDKLHEWEMSRLRENDMVGMGGEEILRAAMCNRSGIPIMHSRDKLGLSLDYWQEKRRVSTKGKKQDRKTWSLLVEVAPLPSLVVGVYTPLRVSDKWISNDIQKADPAVDDLFQAAQLREGPILDWLEPDNTLLRTNSGNKTDGLGVGTRKFPEAIFITKFDPPVIVPYAIAMQIFNSTQAPFDFTEVTTFDGLMFPMSAEDAVRTSESQSRTIYTKRDVVVWGKEGGKDGGKRTVKNWNELFIEKIEYGRVVKEISFSHPRQLVEMLPCLRQFAFLGTVLRRSFEGEQVGAGKVKSKSSSKGTEEQKGEVRSTKKDLDIVDPPTKKREFEVFMKGLVDSSPHSMPGERKPKKGKINVGIDTSMDVDMDTNEDQNQDNDTETHLDVSLSLTPIPRLQVVFDLRGRSANTVFEIRGNGDVVVMEENLLLKGDGEEKGRRKLAREDLARALEVCEDLGVWVEWVRGRL